MFLYIFASFSKVETPKFHPICKEARDSPGVQLCPPLQWDGRWGDSTAEGSEACSPVSAGDHGCPPGAGPTVCASRSRNACPTTAPRLAGKSEPTHSLCPSRTRGADGKVPGRLCLCQGEGGWGWGGEAAGPAMRSESDTELGSGAENAHSPQNPTSVTAPDHGGLQGAGLTLYLHLLTSFSRFSSGAIQRRGFWEYSRLHMANLTPSKPARP